MVISVMDQKYCVSNVLCKVSCMEVHLTWVLHAIAHFLILVRLLVIARSLLLL